jgi:hypothetical protein
MLQAGAAADHEQLSQDAVALVAMFIAALELAA